MEHVIIFLGINQKKKKTKNKKRQNNTEMLQKFYNFVTKTINVLTFDKIIIKYIHDV